MATDTPAPAFLRPSMAHLIGLCPLLALAPDAARALVLAIAIVMVSAIVLPLEWLNARTISPGTRVTVSVLVLASASGTAQLVLDATSHGLHALTATGVPLIAANLALWSWTGALDSAEMGAGPAIQPPCLAAAARRAAAAALLLLLLGMLRELLAHGTLFAEAAALLGARFETWALRPFASEHGLLLLARPAGALFSLACLLAALQAWRSRKHGTQAA